MQIEDELAQFSPPKETLLTIGVFDGVHLGHKFLISQVVNLAKKENLLSCVITFRQHPRDLLAPKSKLLYLCTVEERIQLLKNEGVDIVVALSFNRELAKLSAREFVSLLVKHLKMRGLVIGPDFSLGKNREGNAETLRALGQEMGFSVTVVAPKLINGEVASSTIIRQALADGDMEKVMRLLGRPFSLHGKVARGEHRGTGSGFPHSQSERRCQNGLAAGRCLRHAGVHRRTGISGDDQYRPPPHFRGKQRTHHRVFHPAL